MDPRTSFVYVVTAEGVEALRRSAAAFDSEQEVLAMIAEKQVAAPPVSTD